MQAQAITKADLGLLNKTLLGVNATIAKYEGTDDLQNIDSYIEDLERFCSQTGRCVIQVCHDAFKSEAKDWLRDYTNNGPLRGIPANAYLAEHIRVFYVALKDRFTLSEAQKQSSYAAAFQSRQEAGEKYPAFVSRIQRLCKSLGMSEQHALAISIQGASEKIRPFIITSAPTTIQELLRLPIARQDPDSHRHELIATAEVRERGKDRIDEVAQAFTGQVANVTQSFEGQLSEIAQAFTALTDDFSRTRNSVTKQVAALSTELKRINTPSTGGGNQQSFNKFSSSKASSGATNTEPKKCYKCNYEDCPFLASGASPAFREKCPAAEHVCRHCSKLGHWDNLCRKVSDTPQTNPRRFRQPRSNNRPHPTGNPEGGNTKFQQNSQGEGNPPESK